MELVLKKGQGCALSKCDLKRAYRQFLMDPENVHLLAFYWKGKLFVDQVMVMGLRSGALICQHLTNALVYISKKREIDVVN